MDRKGMNETEKQEQRRLVEQAKRGDKRAFEALYALNATRILYHVGKLLYAREDREDVAQEVALQIYTSIAKLKEPDAFGAWMYRLIKNTCMRHNRDHGKKRHRDIDEYKETLAESSPERQPAEAAESDELSRSIMQVMDGLPERQRTALFLYYYEDMAYDDIASALDISIGSVGSYISRGKNVLKKKIDHKKINGEIETLGGKELGAALFAAFEHDIAHSVSSSSADALVQGSMAQIAHFDAAGGHAASQIHGAAAGVVASKTVPIVVAAVVAAASTAGVAVVVNTQKAPDPAPPAAAVEPYMPVATIDLYDADGNVSRVDPLSARLAVNEGEPLEWRVTDASGAPVAKGTGIEIGADAFSLPPGDYTIEWFVRNDKGQSVTVWSEFEITQ